jgi:glycosyltransferase involved in cell wall biosynthesis
VPRSIEGIFDEIVIVNTGSIDRTKEIAREFGARVFDFEWIDDFAAAWNEALSHVTGDYAFWLDTDEVAEPGQREKLCALLGGLERPAQPAPGGTLRGRRGTPSLATAHAPSPALRATSPRGRGDNARQRGEIVSAQEAPSEDRPAAFVVRCACDPSPDGTGGDTVVDHIRLFPLRDDVRWTYRVHEQILPAPRRAKVPVC